MRWGPRRKTIEELERNPILIVPRSCSVPGDVLRLQPGMVVEYNAPDATVRPEVLQHLPYSRCSWCGRVQAGEPTCPGCGAAP